MRWTRTTSANDGVLADGDLLVVDIGATRDGWASDLTRTIPVSGVFSSRQRELYGLALEAQQMAARRARTAVDSLHDMQDWVISLYRASPLRGRAADGSLQTLDVFNPYRLGHYMGREVHGEDTGWDWTAPLQEGQALTIEPGMYIAREGLGLRVEDDYWVGPVGLECLSCPLVPRGPEDIEAVMDAARANPSALALPSTRRAASRESPRSARPSHAAAGAPGHRARGRSSTVTEGVLPAWPRPVHGGPGRSDNHPEEGVADPDPAPPQGGRRRWL